MDSQPEWGASLMRCAKRTGPDKKKTSELESRLFDKEASIRAWGCPAVDPAWKEPQHQTQNQVLKYLRLTEL